LESLLLVDPHPPSRYALGRALRAEGYRVVAASLAAAAYAVLERSTPDAIVVATAAGVVDGVSFCRGLRAIGVHSPILVLSTRDDVAERIATLDAGADDYMLGPHETVELLARLRALLRRSQPPPRLRTGDLVLDLQRCIVRRGHVEIPLSGREAELLGLFIRTPGHLVTRDQALDQVWHNHTISPNVLNQYVLYLRRKLGQPPLISTVHGVGYRLESG
jgi:two-component system response regulator MprA